MSEDPTEILKYICMSTWICTDFQDEFLRTSSCHTGGSGTGRGPSPLAKTYAFIAERLLGVGGGMLIVLVRRGV